jgi:hypothetical protein
MTDKSTEFRRKLFEAQEMNPILQEAYHKELDALLHETHTSRTRLPAIALLLLMVGIVVGEVRAMLVYSGDARFYVAATIMMAACAFAAAWIARDLWRGKSVRKSSFKVSDLFYGAAGLLTVMQLMHGMEAPSNPASTFGVLFMFVFLFVCGAWSLLNRIASAELSTREEMLRIECRLAEISERLQK